MKILTFTTLYPNHVQKRHGIFVEQRLRKFLQAGDAELKVIAPVPWFPFKSDKFGAYAKYAQVARKEQSYGIDIEHPRYLVIPKIGMFLTPLLLAISAYPVMKKMLKEGDDFDLIDTHYYYPDGVAAAILGTWLKKPVVITARGSDITFIPKIPLAKKMILWAADKAAASITVSNALRQELIALGSDEDKIHTLRNGVDLDFFRPKDRQALRQLKGIKGRCLLSVGNLIELKGHHLIIEAMLQLPDDQLLIAGGGELRQSLSKQVNELQLQERVFFLGTLTHEELVDIYNIADILILASSREGWPNVLLESMACGTPVIATNVWGMPEIVQQAEAGVLIDERSADAIAAGVKELSDNAPSRASTRQYAEGFSWQATINLLRALFEKVSAKK
ncbi:MAG: glycosyltransferase [Methyloprofundus sp.]|nr:glycosyltransferase [Methyloprofundus sp.]